MPKKVAGGLSSSKPLTDPQSSAGQPAGHDQAPTEGSKPTGIFAFPNWQAGGDQAPTEGPKPQPLPDPQSIAEWHAGHHQAFIDARQALREMSASPSKEEDFLLYVGSRMPRNGDPLRRISSWQAGYSQAFAVIAQDIRKDAMRRGQLALAEALRSVPKRDGSRGQAGKNRLRRKQLDEDLLPRLVALIRQGEVNKTVAAKLRIGKGRVKRLRALAVKRGLLRRRERH